MLLQLSYPCNRTPLNTNPTIGSLVVCFCHIFASRLRFGYSRPNSSYLKSRLRKNPAEQIPPRHDRLIHLACGASHPEGHPQGQIADRNFSARTEAKNWLAIINCDEGADHHNHRPDLHSTEGSDRRSSGEKDKREEQDILIQRILREFHG